MLHTLKFYIFHFVLFKGPEYGTTEAAWKGILVEADRLSDLHLKIREFMCNDVTAQIRTWQKDSYHKVRLELFFLFTSCVFFKLVGFKKEVKVVVRIYRKTQTYLSETSGST